MAEDGMKLPLSGSVLGIDVGWSTIDRTSAICRLTWTSDSVFWQVERCTFLENDRRLSIARVVGDHTIRTAAIDGPLGPNLVHLNDYRAAERMLTRGLQKHIGKPGQTSSPNGILLNRAATAFASDVLKMGVVEAASHDEAIHEHAIVEAFPTSFMGVLVGNPTAIPKASGARSDWYFSHLAENGRLSALLASLLPGRVAQQRFPDIRDHDERAGLACALTALAVAAHDYSAVGDNSGWIILPPLRFMAPWVAPAIRANEVSGFSGRFVSWNQGRQLVL